MDTDAYNEQDTAGLDFEGRLWQGPQQSTSSLLALSCECHIEGMSCQRVFHESIDPTLDFFYRPHTISALVAIVSGLLYVAIYTDDSNVQLNTKWALSAISIIFVIIGIILFRDGPFIRPHPAFWRAVLALNVLYEMCLIFLLFQA
ncbi:hypothetical protein EV182_001917, partial [Spiromyces aspiralis]